MRRYPEALEYWQEARDLDPNNRRIEERIEEINRMQG